MWGWGKLLKHLGKTNDDAELLLYSVIVEPNGLDDAPPVMALIQKIQV